MGWNISLPDAEWYDLASPGLEALVREVEAQTYIAIDTETTGLNVVKDIPLYWSLAWGNRRVCMPAATMHAFKRAFADIYKHWIYANAKFDVHMQAQVGIEVAGRLIDTQVMHALIYEERPHGLKTMAKEVLGWGWKDFFDTFHPLNVLAEEKEHGGDDTEDTPKRKRKPATRKETIGEMLQRFEKENLAALVEYASNDAYGTLQVFLKLRTQLQNETTWSLYPEKFANLWDVFYKTEVPFTKVLWKCERNGLLIDTEYLEKARGPVEDGIVQIEKDIAKIMGRVVNLNSTDTLRDYFFVEKGYRSTKKTKGGKTGVKLDSVDAYVLEDLATHDPVAKKLLEHRDLSKLHGTYLVGLAKHLDKNNRIHCRLNQDIARCLPAGELVLTNRGYISVEKVQVNDKVISHTGAPRAVVEISKHDPTPIIRVVLSNGLELRTTSNHQYLTNNGWVCAGMLQEGDIVSVHSDKEEWRPILTWEPFEVSSWGRVRNAVTGNVLTLFPKGKWGHLKVCLARNGAQKRGVDKKDFAVHRLVLAAFKGALLQGETRHLNGIAWDNTIRNLALGTSLENRHDALVHGALSQRRAGRTILTQEAVDIIRRSRKAKQPPAFNVKLNYQLAEGIRKERESGEAVSSLAKRYGTSIQTIYAIIKRKTYTEEELSDAVPAENLARKFGVSAGYLREVRRGTKWKSENYIEGVHATFYEVRVKKIELETPEVTYGLTVADDHSHVTGGIVTHNTGRLSSSNPNLQTIPKPESDKYKIRRAFIAPPGHDLIVIDYDQLEMRLLAAAAQEPEMVNIFLSGRDIHMGNAELVFGPIYEKRYGRKLTYQDLVDAKKIDKEVKAGKRPETDITEWVERCLFARNAIKSVGFGLNYGMKEKKLAGNIGVPVDEAKFIMDAYMATYPTVKRFFDDSVEVCRENLKAFTLIGRRRFLPEINARNPYERFQAERQAGNTIIQGTAADAARLAMISCDEAQLEHHYGAHMLLQVHDELIFECPKETSGACMVEVKEWMEHPFPSDLDVPLTASAGRGANWVDAK